MGHTKPHQAATQCSQQDRQLWLDYRREVNYRVLLPVDKLQPTRSSTFSLQALRLGHTVVPRSGRSHASCHQFTPALAVSMTLRSSRTTWISRDARRLLVRMAPWLPNTPAIRSRDIRPLPRCCRREVDLSFQKFMPSLLAGREIQGILYSVISVSPRNSH